MTLKFNEQLLAVVGKAMETALGKVTPDVGISVNDTYQCLDLKMKRKLGKRHLNFVFTSGLVTASGKPIKLENGNFTLDPTITTPDSSQNSEYISSQESNGAYPAKKRKSLKKPVKSIVPVPSPTVREKSERKRTQKIVFDPSDLEQPTKKSMKIKMKNELDFEDTESSVMGSQCKLCESDIIDLEDTSTVSTCGECRLKVHRACLDSAESLKTTEWRCDSCKVCLKCHGERTPKWEAWVHCEICGDPFHQKCVLPKRSAASNWMCNKCKKVFQEDDSQENKNEVNEPKPKKKVPRRKSTSKKINGNAETVATTELPDCSDWTPEQVYSYFLAYLPSHDAKVLLDQEIDGKVLLLLSRTDILTKFNLKLGPALKLYLYIKRLQLRSADIRHCWT